MIPGLVSSLFPPAHAAWCVRELALQHSSPFQTLCLVLFFTEQITLAFNLSWDADKPPHLDEMPLDVDVFVARILPLGQMPLRKAEAWSTQPWP